MKASIRYNDDRIAGTESQFKRWHINANTTSCMHLLHRTLALLRKFYASSSSSSPSLSYYHSFIILRFLHYPYSSATSISSNSPQHSTPLPHSLSIVACFSLPFHLQPVCLAAFGAYPNNHTSPLSSSFSTPQHPFLLSAHTVSSPSF